MRQASIPRLPPELRRDVNRAAYAVAQAGFLQLRARLTAEAAQMLREGRPLAEVRAAMLARELGA